MNPNANILSSLIQQQNNHNSKSTFLPLYLGEIDYAQALKKQELLFQARIRGQSQDILLLLQHPHVFTVGRFRGESDFTADSKTIAEKGIPIFHTNRGGSITYHGPGQLIGYPIIDLKKARLSVREYICNLEEVVLLSLHNIGIRGRRLPNLRGVWIDERKVCSIGINITNHITTHGFALNVNTDLSYFKMIDPCGLPHVMMTSIAKTLGTSAPMDTVIDNVVHYFSAVFEMQIDREGKECLSVCESQSG